MILNLPCPPKPLKIPHGVKLCQNNMMLLFKMVHKNLFPQNQSTIFLGVSGFFILSINLIVLLTSTKLILSPKYFSNDQALIIMIFLVLLSNPPLYIWFLVLQSTMVGFSANLMLIVLFFIATCLKMFSWLNHWDSLTVIILIMCVNFTKLSMVSSKHYMLSIMSSISFFSPLASLTLILTLDYLSSTLVVPWFISLFMLIMLS